MNFAYFGSSQFSIYVLNSLEKAGFIPSIVVTTPDKPAGRKLILTPTPVKVWAEERNSKGAHIIILDAAKLDATFVQTLGEKMAETKTNLFIVASYGKIIPQSVLDLPTQKTLNVHPSLLPQYRGASPLQSAMLDDTKATGVTIMELDALMDHGPIVAQKKITVSEWPPYAEFEEMMGIEGGDLLAATLPDWISGKIQGVPQIHDQATFTKKIAKEDGLIDLNDDPYKNFRKIQAYSTWPSAYFFIERNGKQVRIKITKASFTDGKLAIEKVIPEGKNEIDYELLN